MTLGITQLEAYIDRLSMIRIVISDRSMEQFSTVIEMSRLVVERAQSDHLVPK